MDDVLEYLSLFVFLGVSTYYYYQLYLSNKIAKFVMILEVSIKTWILVLYLDYGGGYSLLEYIFFAPIVLSVALYLTKGLVAKILFGALVSFVVIDVLYLAFIPYINTYWR